MKFKGKTALITGASRGIGLSIAKEMAALGADIVLNYIGDEALATSAKTELEALGAKVLLSNTDVTDYEACERMVNEAVKEFGGIDVLVNNAGITKDNLLMRMKEEDYDVVMNVNAKGTFNCMKLVSRVMLKAKYGRIVSIGSVVGTNGNAGQVNYAASKAAIIGMSKSLARELAGKKITVNVIAPGFIETDMTAALKDDVVENVRASIPMKEMGTAEDVAKAVCFLASDDAKYITGQVLKVDGGLMI